MSLDTQQMKQKGLQGPWPHTAGPSRLPSWSQMLAADNELRGHDWDKDAMGCADSLGGA